MLAVQVLGWVGSALLVYSVLQTRILPAPLQRGRLGAAGCLQHAHRCLADDIQHFNPGYSDDDAARAEFGFLILTGTETVGLVPARNANDGSAQVDLDYVVPKYQGFTLGESVYRPSGPMAARGDRKVIAPPRMQHAGDYLTGVGFRREGDAMVRDLT